MFAFNDMDFMAGQAFPNMPSGINLGLDGWLRAGGLIRTLRRVQPMPFLPRQPSRRDQIKVKAARVAFTGCGWAA